MKPTFFLLILIVFGSCGKTEKINTIPITTKSEKARQYYHEARHFQNQYELDSASNRIDKALEEDSAFAMGYLLKGMVSENFETRRMNVIKALDLSPQTSNGEQLWIKARNIFYGNQEGDSTELQYFNKLVELYPQDPYANFMYGFVNHHHNNSFLDTAIAYLKKAVALDGKLTLAIDDLAYAYLEIGDFKSAEKMALRNVGLLPNLATPKNTYAEILMRLGKHNQSIESYKKALAVDSNSAWSVIGIAANLNYLNKHVEARKTLDQLDAFNDISDYNFRHKWRGRVVSFIDEGKLDSAILVLENQKQLGLSKATTHEPLFHAYMSFVRKINLLFEIGDVKNGQREYKAWLKFVEENFTRASTIKNVKDQGDFYNAYTQFHSKNYSNALNSLEKYKETINEENTQYKRLKSAILSANNNPIESLNLLKSTGLEGPYEQAEYAMILFSHGQKEEGEKWKNKVLTTFLIDDIDLALARMKLKSSNDD